jgi:polar amino acid transport system substrate-binding protein
MKFAAQRIVILAGFMFIVSVVTQSFASENIQTIKFTETEQKWLEEKRILRFSEVNWKPLSDVDHFPDYQGIIAEYLKIVSDATGMKLDFQKSNTWHEVITKFKNGELDLIPAVSIWDDICPNIVFTQPYITFPLVIATRLNADFIGYTNELNGKKVGVGRNYTSYFFLKNNYPQITLIQTDDVLQGLRLLEKKEIDAVVGHLAVIDHIIKHTNIGVKIAGKTEYDFEHRVGINKENNGAVEIFNKVFSSIGSRQHNLIYNKWIKMGEKRVDYAFIWKIAILLAVFFSGVGAFIIYRYYLLNQLNQKLIAMANTDVLTQCANRKKLNEELEAAAYGLQRYNIPYSLILIDLDNFKHVNDCFGHAIGDEVLKAVSLILRNNVRQMDTVGRWGGEEFLIVCTNTDIFGAKETAEKLHRYIQSYHFPEIRNMTASFGLAQCGKTESIKDLFVRIDAALYRAKANGKNRVEIA